MKIFKSYICVISIFISLSAYSFAAENTAEISQAATGEGTVNEISLEEYFRIEAEKGAGLIQTQRLLARSTGSHSRGSDL